MPDHSSIKVISTLTPQIDEGIEALLDKVMATALSMPEGRDIGFDAQRALTLIKDRIGEWQQQIS